MLISMETIEFVVFQGVPDPLSPSGSAHVCCVVVHPLA